MRWATVVASARLAWAYGLCLPSAQVHSATSHPMLTSDVIALAILVRLRSSFMSRSLGGAFDTAHERPCELYAKQWPIALAHLASRSRSACERSPLNYSSLREINVKMRLLRVSRTRRASSESPQRYIGTRKTSRKNDFPKAQHLDRRLWRYRNLFGRAVFFDVPASSTLGRDSRIRSTRIHLIVDGNAWRDVLYERLTPFASPQRGSMELSLSLTRELSAAAATSGMSWQELKENLAKAGYDRRQRSA